MNKEQTLRFWSHVEKSDGCWLWNASTRKGYGVFCPTKRHKESAHRVSYELAFGNAGELFVLHKCDNRLCVNPAHLFLGTNAENMADKKAKGRQARGERNAGAKLTADDVMRIRTNTFGATQKQLAAAFGVSTTTVASVVSGRTWAHLPGAGT